MQAQLLSTVPPCSIEIGDGQAANEETFDFVSPAGARPVLSLAQIQETVPQLGKARVATNPSDDDYWLGGYAGI